MSAVRICCCHIGWNVLYRYCTGDDRDVAGTCRSHRASIDGTISPECINIQSIVGRKQGDYSVSCLAVVLLATSITWFQPLPLRSIGFVDRQKLLSTRREGSGPEIERIITKQGQYCSVVTRIIIVDTEYYRYSTSLSITVIQDVQSHYCFSLLSLGLYFSPQLRFIKPSYLRSSGVVLFVWHTIADKTKNVKRKNTRDILVHFYIVTCAKVISLKKLKVWSTSIIQQF